MPDVSCVSLWQYTDRGSVPGVNGNCDVSYSYMDISGETITPNTDTAVYLAERVIAGEYGNGEDRKRRLGDDYTRVQALVNYITDGKRYKARVVDLVLSGAYGNGNTRKEELGRYYNEIQKAVNARLR